MQPDTASPKYITSCSSCLEICSQIHPSNLPHKTVRTHTLETQISSALNQNYDQWLGIFEKLQTSIQRLLHSITSYLHNLDQAVNEYRNVLILNKHQSPREEQEIISKAMAKLSQFKYQDLSCDQIQRITLAFKQKEQNDTTMAEQYERMEDKVLFDLHEIVSMNFSCLQPSEKKIQIPPKFKIEKTIKDKKTTKEIDPTEISQKIKELMKEEMQKIKPLINEEISKVKIEMISHQQKPKGQSKKDQKKQQNEAQGHGYWDKMYGNFRDRYQQSQDESFDDKSLNESRSTYQKTEAPKRFANDKSETESIKTMPKNQNSCKPSKICHAEQKVGRFNCTVKVLAIIQKQMKFGGKICTRFLGGDQTGAATFMIQHSPLIEPGNNIIMEYIKLTNFNHQKQGQFTEKTKISRFNDKILNVGSFRLGEEAKNIFNSISKEIQVLIGREHNQLRQQKKKQQMPKIEPQKKPEKKAYMGKEQAHNSQPPQSNKTANQPNERTRNNQPPKNNNTTANQMPPKPQNNYKKVKICQIRPLETGYQLTGQILKVISADGQNKVFLLGDETGVVNCEIPCAKNGQFKHGVHIELLNFAAQLDNGHDGHVLMRQHPMGQIKPGNKAPPSINRSTNISQQQYTMNLPNK